MRAEFSMSQSHDPTRTSAPAGEGTVSAAAAALRDQILAASALVGDRRELSCTAAHALADALGVELARIGELCQSENIKVTDCQLGCFGRRRS